MVESMEHSGVSFRSCHRVRMSAWIVFGVCGAVGILLDADHLLFGGRQFHGPALVIAIGGLICGLIGALCSRYMGGLLNGKT